MAHWSGAPTALCVVGRLRAHGIARARLPEGGLLVLDQIRNKLYAGQPARPIDYFMLGAMLVLILLLGTMYVRGVHCSF